ncbi:hypothetical protein LTR74_018647, partial [Friedmanniomyces endolithicus]
MRGWSVVRTATRACNRQDITAEQSISRLADQTMSKSRDLLTTASPWSQMGRLGRRLQKACRMGRARSIMATRRRRRALPLTPRLASSLALFQISLGSRF